MSDHVAKGQEAPAEAVSGDLRPRAHKASDARDHLVELDALRGIAVLGVVFGHFTDQWRINVGPLPIPGIAWDALNLLEALPGVHLFFVLTGYLLAWTEERRARRGSYSLRSYALRRAVRIVPAYYAAILVVLLVWPRTPSLGDLLSHLTFTHGLTPYYARTMSSVFWSLTPAMVFYCLLPFIVLKLPRLRHRLALFAALFLISLPTQIMYIRSLGEKGNVTYEEFNPLQFYASFPTTWLFLFVAGVLLRMLVEHLNERPASPLRSYVALALFLGSVALMLSATGYGEGELSLGTLMIRYSSVIAFVVAALLGAPVLRGILKWRVLGFIGLVSYSMFLFHQTLLMLASRYVLRDPRANAWITQSDLTAWASFSAYVVVLFMAILAVSYLGYRYVESPFLRIKPK